MASSKLIPAFLDKTYKLVSAPETNDIVHWNYDGTTFIIERPRSFAEDILPQYFRHNKFSSFVRQLNFYGFHKLRSDDAGTMHAGKIDPNAEEGWWEFRHEFFQKGKRDLLTRIKRKTQHDAGDGKADVEELRMEVMDLKSQLADLTRSVSSITQLLVNSGINSSTLAAGAAATNNPGTTLPTPPLLPQQEAAAAQVVTSFLPGATNVPPVLPTVAGATSEKKRKLDIPDNAVNLLNPDTLQADDLMDLNQDLDSFFATLDFDSFVQSGLSTGPIGGGGKGKNEGLFGL